MPGAGRPTDGDGGDHLAGFAEQVGPEGPVAVEGHRTSWDAGGALAQGTRTVRAPSGVLEHRPEEMTVRVLAGTPVAELHTVLAGAGQRTSLPERGGTVGGALAVGHDHPEAPGRGRCRHALLQVRYVSAEGRLVTAGGPMIKNVSGYDLPRLVVGSLGTIGLIGEVILRTNPVPAASRWVTAVGTDPWRAAHLVRRPSVVLWDGQRTWVHLEGHAVDVEDGLAVLGGDGPFEPADGPPPLPPHRWSVAPGEVRRLVAGGPGGEVASVTTGAVFAPTPQPQRAPDPGVLELCRRIKHAFDPTGRLAPGRSLVGAA